MLYLYGVPCPTLHWWICIIIPVFVASNQASFDLEKSLAVTCDRHCFNGICLNGSCVCAKGWTGPQCDHCYGRVRLSEDQTHLTDGPLSYSSSSKCTWIIENEKNVTGPLNIRLDNFQTECGWDFVYIYDGNGVHGEQLAAFCGEQPQREIVAQSGKALIYFFSDLAMNLDGFNISYVFDRCLYNCSNRGVCTNGKCKCDIGYTGDYCNVRVCTAEDEGSTGPCLNKGVCRNGSCDCPQSAHGDFCETLSTASVWNRLRVENRPSGRASHASVLVDDVLWTIGGEQFSDTMSDTIVVFNITSEVWTTISVVGSEKPAARYDHSLVRYKNKLYMFGGVVARSNITGELWSFDMNSRMWKLESVESDKLSVAPLAASGHTAHVIGSEMLVFFGYHPSIGFIYHVQIYNFDTGVWRFSKTKDQVYGRYKHTSVHYSSEQGDVILVYGGIMWSNVQTNNLTDSLMQYNVVLEKWTNLPPSGVHLFLHTSTLINGLMVVVAGNGYNISNAHSKQDCFSGILQAYDVACKQWYNMSVPPSELKRYGHSTVAAGNNLYVFGGFDGRMLDDIWKLTPATCEGVSRPEHCRAVSDGVKCIFADRSCVKFDPSVSYKPSFLSFVKNESPKGLVECRETPLRQALQICDEQSDCLSCVSQSGCGWCPSGDQCLPNDGECVDGQVMFTTWQKCPSARDSPLPRPCSMASDCHSCKLLSHCNWFPMERKSACISLEEEAVLLTERNNRELKKITSSSIALRNPPLSLPTVRQNSTTCPAACAELSECTSCISRSKCMWCPNTHRCIEMEAYTLSFPYGQCHSWLTSNTPGLSSKICAEESADCDSHRTCHECLLSPQCGWMDDGSNTGLGACLEGTSEAPLGSVAETQGWHFLDCPACHCNGHSTCESNLLTNGSDVPSTCGVCAHNTTGKHCEVCANGFFGDPRNGGTCMPCECHGQADSCDPQTGFCYCRTKGVTGNHCEKCDTKYYGTPSNGTPCYYELTVDFIFTFKLKDEDKDKHATEIFLFSIPYKRDTDVTFQISCDQAAFVALHQNSSHFIDHRAKTRKLMSSTFCDHRGFRRVYSASDDGWAFGTDANTTFFVRVYNFTTPITIQVSFAQSPPINWVLFFVIFAACFIVLLVVAGLLWMVKLRIEVYRRNQRRIDEIEHMASRPFANVKLELTTHLAPAAVGPTPLSVEPCGNYKAGVFTLAVRLPTGGRATTPNGTSGLAVASALCQLTPAQLGVLQAPDNSENKTNRKTNIRQYIPFLRDREAENS